MIEDTTQPQEEQNPFDLFPPEVSSAVDGLMFLGHLEKEVEFCGHTFLIRTLKADEELQVALVAKEFMDTFGQVKALAWAHVAAALMAVDGEEDFCPAIGPSKRDHVRAKFRFLTSNWYQPVGDYLFNQYTDLNEQARRAVREIEDLSRRSLRTSWAVADSSTGQESSPEATSADSKSSASNT